MVSLRMRKRSNYRTVSCYYWSRQHGSLVSKNFINCLHHSVSHGITNNNEDEFCSSWFFYPYIIFMYIAFIATW